MAFEPPIALLIFEVIAVEVEDEPLTKAEVDESNSMRQFCV